MNSIMYLPRLENFTPQIALKALKQFLSKKDLSHLKLSTNNLNLIKNGISDDLMIKYVISIGDILYQIVAIDSCHKNDTRVSVVVDQFQLCAKRKFEKDISIKLEDFTPNSALKYLKESMSEFDSIRVRLTLEKINRIYNGILDSNMVKYVVSTGYGLYQVVAIQEPKLNIVTVVVKYSQL